MLAVLLATIPAFYAELLEASARWASGAVYLLAAVVMALARWRLRHQAQAGWEVRKWLDALLVPGLAIAAVLPASADSQGALVWRLAVSGLILLRMVSLVQAWLTRGSLHHVLALSLAVLGACGIGFWLLEPRAITLADGLWLAFTTAATVGYGDIVPTTPASKIFAVFVVLLGYAALSLVTASIAAMWVESTERQVEQDILNELHREVKALRSELAALRGRLGGL